MGRRLAGNARDSFCVLLSHRHSANATKGERRIPRNALRKQLVLYFDRPGEFRLSHDLRGLFFKGNASSRKMTSVRLDGS